jgi:hypothetical protein
MLNKRFEQWIQEMVGDVAYIELKKTDGYRAAMQHFDLTIKPAFRSKQDPDRWVSFPTAKLKDDASKGIVKNSITLKGSVGCSKRFPLVAYLNLVELRCSTYLILSSETSTNLLLSKSIRFELSASELITLKGKPLK